MERQGQTAPRVLVAEDALLEALTVEDVVRALGCKPLGPATSLERVRAIVEKKRVDAAVLDVNLGGDLVFDAAKDLADQGIPLLFVTGYDPSKFPTRFKSALLLRKPYIRSQLEVMVMTLLKRLREAARFDPLRTISDPG